MKYKNAFNVGIKDRKSGRRQGQRLRMSGVRESVRDSRIFLGYGVF